MKQMMRLLACLLVLMMAASCALGVEKAAQLTEMDALEHYPAYVCDSETGKWSVHAYQADALMDRFWSFGIKNSSFTVVFHLAAEGDVRTGVWTPILRLYAIDGETINARAVSLMANGQRYDFAASSAQVRNGRYSAECITVPLNAEGLAFVSSMQQVEEASIRLIGDEVYTVSLSRSAETGRRALEAESLRQLGYGVELLENLGASDYRLWDLSAEAWEREYGYRPAVTVGSVSAAIGETALTDTMGMVIPEITSDAAQTAQNMLVEYGFLSGETTRKFDENAVAAVLRAQKYLGRVSTGCFDEALAQAMADGRCGEAADETAMQQLGSAAQVGLERFWFAQGVSASANPDTLRSVVNADNLFLVADGCINSLSAQEMHLFVEMKASVVYNGQYTYQAELVCEGSEGTALDTRLLPLAQARLLVYAEIPAALAADENAQWSIVLEQNGESLVIDLQ